MPDRGCASLRQGAAPSQPHQRGGPDRRHSGGAAAAPSRHNPASLARASGSANSYGARSFGDRSSMYFLNHQARPIVICARPASMVIWQSGMHGAWQLMTGSVSSRDSLSADPGGFGPDLESQLLGTGQNSHTADQGRSTTCSKRGAGMDLCRTRIELTPRQAARRRCRHRRWPPHRF